MLPFRLSRTFQSSLPKIVSSRPRYASHTANLNHGIQSIQASQDEINQGRLTENNLEMATRSILEDGIFVIENAIDHHHLDKLNRKMIKDAMFLASLGDKSPFNYNPYNIQQDAPPVKDFFEPEIFLNPLASHITSTVLGPQPKLTFMSGNTALPTPNGTAPQRQPVHSDADFAHPRHPFALVVNVPLVSLQPENGSTEIWPGTHTNFGLEAQEGAHGERASGRIKTELLEQRRQVCPPLQPVVPKGSIIVRDLRLWHAGMPNLTSETRIMLAMIHFAPWYRNQMRLEMSEKLRPLLDTERCLDVRADFVSEEKANGSYLNRGFGNSYDFDQIP